MTPVRTASPAYDARIRRAQYLAEEYAFAGEVLTFYVRLAEFQRRLYSQFPARLSRIEAAPADPTAAFRAPLDLALLMPHFPHFLSLLQRVGPAPIADAARQRASQTPAAWGDTLARFWTAATSDSFREHGLQSQDFDPLADLIFRAFLQPLAEFLATACAVPPASDDSAVCPLCGCLPLLGVLRPEGDGGKRHLVCSWCLHEWAFRRIRCACCGEASESKLPVFVADQFPHIRVEACNTCRRYLRSIELTKDGRAVPIVDDLAAIPLSLWAHENNYSRIHGNLLGT
jgi:formate dehydrogenase accessory protein FdhE